MNSSTCAIACSAPSPLTLEPRRELIASLATALLTLPRHVRKAFAEFWGRFKDVLIVPYVCRLLTFVRNGKPETSLGEAITL